MKTMKTKRLDEVDVAHIRSEIALFLNTEVVNPQGWFNHPQPSVAWVPPLPLLLLFCCLQTCLVNWWQLLWYMYIYTCECMWIGCDNFYDICIWMFSDVCVVLPWNIWTISFISGCATRKSVKKGTLTNISVAVRFSELPRITHIRGGWIVVTATYMFLRVPFLLHIRSGSNFRTAKDMLLSVVAMLI